MTELVVRRLLIDLEAPFPGRWNGGDAFRSAFFNALSMSFPAGEQFFIDSVREGFKTLGDADRERLGDEVQGFVGQEATHRRIHSLFNAHLERLGYDNEIERRALRRRQAHAHDDLRNHVAATAATEHFTALFADWLLHHPEVYRAMGGSEHWRVRVFKYISLVFLGDVARQTLRNLWHDKSLFKWGTWSSCYRLLFAPGAMLRGNYPLWRDYMAPGFHPSQHDDSLSRRWLSDNTAQFSVLGQAKAA